MVQLYKPWDLRLSDEDVAKFGEVPFDAKYFYLSKELNDLCNKWWYYAEMTPIYDEVNNLAQVKTNWFKRTLLDYLLKNNSTLRKLNDKDSLYNYISEEEVLAGLQEIQKRY